MSKTMDTAVDHDQPKIVLASADEIFNGPIVDFLTLSGEERDWFKNLLYNQIEDEAEKEAFVEAFREFLKRYPEVKLRVIEAIRNRHDKILKGFLKHRFTAFLEQWELDYRVEKPVKTL